MNDVGTNRKSMKEMNQKMQWKINSELTNNQFLTCFTEKGVTLMQHRLGEKPRKSKHIM